MSEFEKELESILEKNGEYYQGITTGNVLGISKHFKDWQPPKQLVEVPQRFEDCFDVDLLSSSIDEIERVLIGNKSDEVNTVYLKNAIRFIKTYINGIEENKERINPLIKLVQVDEV